VSAGFTASPTSGVGPLQVSFVNESTGNLDTCTWDFGDGGTSSDCLDPTHTYTATGVFTVSLTVSGPGGTDTLTRDSYITVEQKYVICLPLVARSGPARHVELWMGRGPVFDRDRRISRM
jgi:PKD repeat protein